MATKTQFLPYAHRYQDPTVGLREALHGIQTGMVQRGELRVREADQKLRQEEMDRHAEKRSFLASYQPTLTEDHLTNDGLERYNSLIEHNQDRLSAMGDDERESVRQKLLRETADAGRVARTVREDIMRSGIFDPADVDVLATSYGSGYTDFAEASKTAYDADVERAKGRADVFKNAAHGLSYVFGNGNTKAGGASAAATDPDKQALLAAGYFDPKTGMRPGFSEIYNNQNNPLLKRYNDFFQDDPRKDRYIDLLENRGLVTYQKNALTPEFIDELVKVATADNSLGLYNNALTKQNVEAGVKAYYDNLNKTAADGGGRVAAPPPEVLRQVLFDGVKKGGFLSDHVNKNANAFFASSGAAEIGALFEKAHDKYLEDSEKELEALQRRMAEGNFDFYGTKFPELNQKFYREKPAPSKQDYRTYLGRTETEGAYPAPTQAAQQPYTQQQPSAVTQGLDVQGQPITPAQQLEQLGQTIKLPADVKEEHFGGLEAFPSPEAFTAVMLPMAEEAAARIGVSPQHILVQAALETGWGKKPVVSVDGKPTYNLFGIKAYGGWNGPSALVNTTEEENGVEVPKQEPFRVYNSFAESFVDYVNFLQQNPRYSKALEIGATGDGPAFLNAIADAGYATSSKYKEKVQGVLRSVERRIPEGYTPGNFVSSPAAQQYTNTQGAGIQPQEQQLQLPQQGHPATEHLRALLDTYPQPYTEKSFTYDKIDAAFRRLGLTVPAAEKVQAHFTPVAAGVGSFPRMQVGTPAAPAVQPAPAVTEAAPASGKEAPLAFAEQQKIANREADTKFQAWLESTLGGKPYPETLEDVRRRKAEREKLLQNSAEEPVKGNLWDIFWKAGPGEASWGPFTFRHLPTDRNRERANPIGQEAAQGKWRETMQELFPSTAGAIGVRGDMGLVYDPNSDPYTATEQAERIARGDMLLGGPGYGPQAATRAGQTPQTPQTPQASTGRTAPPLRPTTPQVEAKSLPVQREENSNNFLMLRQDRQQELRDMIDSRTNQGINSNQQPEQEAANETAGASERYQMLADIIREFQQSVGSNRQMALGNIA